MKKKIIILKNILFKIKKLIILKNINISIYNNEIITIIGPNGAGKSTLAKIILGLLLPTKGTLYVKKNIRIGYVPQKFELEYLMPLTVDRFLKTVQTVNKEFHDIIFDLNISHLINKSLYNLSGGELQRCIIARILLSSPNLLILDEPMQGIDIKNQIQLYKLMKNICKNYKCSVLLISHDLNLVMSETNKIICLNQFICCSGKPSKISQDPSFIKLFGNYLECKLDFYIHKHN